MRVSNNAKNSTKAYQNYFKITAYFFLLSLLFQSCGDSSTNPVNTYDYLPLAVGRYQIYQVSEEVYSSGQSKPVIRLWQEKDEVSRVSTNTNGISTYIVSRYSRNLATDYWQKVKEYAIEQFPDKLILNIDNQNTVPLIFPIDSKVIWNGNMYNTLDKEDYHYQDINQPYQLEKLSFDNSLTVVERADTTSVITYSLGLKRYALGVGLVYDEQTAYDFCQATPDCIGQGVVDSGTHKVRKIIEYGTL
ncbi:hypothetical protein [Dyadobacter sp. LHD-138]|uniref:hypothetical protein n=1 Tax=Dyadobacter sp. LHD-138 TaxID=3071413 RepID=UPI0027DF54C1|nr:hypothetical protein [Dyadobacter sp. LHD-138]MDQ6478907.1 hypothetical protein [Dyadobacter sp. LHD-138]